MNKEELTKEIDNLISYIQQPTNICGLNKDKELVSRLEKVKEKVNE